MSLSAGAHTVAISAASVSTLTTSGINTQISGSGFVVGVIWLATVAFASITDSKNNTWVQVGTELTSAFAKTRFYKVENGVGGTGHTFTLNTATAGPCTLFVIEITTTNGNGVITDQSGGQLSPTSPFNSPNLTTTTASEILVGVTMDDATAGDPVSYTDNGPQGFTQLDTSPNANATWTGVSAFKLVSAIGTYHTSWTESGPGFTAPNNTHDWLITFREAPLSSVSDSLKSSINTTFQKSPWSTYIIGKSQDTPVIDIAVSQVTGNWLYFQNFSLVYTRQSLKHEFDVSVSDFPIGSVNNNWNYTQNFTFITRTLFQTIVDGIQPFVTLVINYIPTFRPRRR